MESFMVYHPRPGEAEIYAELWQMAVQDDADILKGARAVEFFKKSGLDLSTLKAIWTWSSPDPVMNRQQFYTALRYISMSQNGENLSKGKTQLSSGFI
jgi:hypothetical protein